MENFNYEDFYNYTYEEVLMPHEASVFEHKSSCPGNVLCVSLLVINAVQFVLGFCGNALVIWISGFKMKKTVNTTWYLSLAISDFVFCTFLPFIIINMAMEKWIFGFFLCKFTSSVLFLNMFSSIFLLVIISIDRCVSVIFPVWSQNHRTVRKASLLVVLAWVLAIGLSLPSAVFRDVQSQMGRSICYNNYTSPQTHKIIAMSRFVAGFVVPFVVISICYSVIILKLRMNRMTKSSKPFKVMTALIATFFICWLPYHVFILLEINHQHFSQDVLKAGQQIGTTLVAANSFLNPVLYVFMGNDFKQSCKSSLMSKMENAMGDEGRTISRYLSRSSSVDAKLSTHI
ncbi:chemerin-like receptor 1 [Corythoichthys intestinalis]|uniref:chemerin-like receptor 1 n=1 Tax=Corythoichthys intestinalis TaxID=161448 RepID=UPI0025A5657B|nr:chemerin-like receptor 1 [Corythoichthys intestinalis]XP_061804149.1 chemerin-like receptor 1 [Nerophis lumbriciformis]